MLVYEYAAAGVSVWLEDGRGGRMGMCYYRAGLAWGCVGVLPWTLSALVLGAGLQRVVDT